MNFLYEEIFNLKQNNKHMQLRTMIDYSEKGFTHLLSPAYEYPYKNFCIFWLWSYFSLTAHTLKYLTNITNKLMCFRFEYRDINSIWSMWITSKPNDDCLPIPITDTRLTNELVTTEYITIQQKKLLTMVKYHIWTQYLMKKINITGIFVSKLRSD